MLNNFLFILFYTSFFLFIQRHSPLLKKTSNTNLFGFLFVIKVLFGVLYIYIYQTKYTGGDSKLYFSDSKIIFETLFDKPLVYFQLVFGYNNSIEIPENIEKYVNEMGFWRDTAAYMIVRLNAILRVFSFNNYYAQTIIICFISFLGQLQVYHFFKRQIGYLTSHKFLIFSVFLIPSVLFWTSGIHKEALIIFCFGFILNNSSLLVLRKRIARRLIIISLMLLLLFLLRPYLFYLIIPALIAYFLCKYIEKKYLLLFASIYTFYFLLISISYSFITDNSLLCLLQLKHLQFSILLGSSNIETTDVSSWHIMFTEIPNAIFNTLLRPTLWEAKGLLQWVIAIENLITLILFIYVLIKVKFLALLVKPELLLVLFYCISVLIIIGLVVPNLGAINRYKSVILPLLYSIIVIYYAKTKSLSKPLP